MTHSQKVFTLEQANQLLPEIEKLLGSVQQKQERYSQRHDLLFMHQLLTQAENKTLAADEDTPELDQEIRELEEAVADLEKDLVQIRKFGCFIRSVENGMIDFPGELKGKRVYFCWKRGEKSIRYYRLMEGDAANRLPLDL